MPADPVISQYQGDSGRLYQERKRAVPEVALPWVARLRAAKIQPHIHADDTVLEFGVGLGWNLAMLTCRRKLGHDVAGFLASLVEPQGIKFVADLSTLGAGSIDVVVCHHTLEHVLEPAATLREIHRLLRSPGRLLLFVPFEKERRYRRFDRAEPNHHLFSWNVQTLGNLVEAAEFTVQAARVGTFGYDRFAAQWAVRLRLGETGFRWLRQGLHLVRPGREVRLAACKS